MLTREHSKILLVFVLCTLTGTICSAAERQEAFSLTPTTASSFVASPSSEPRPAARVPQSPPQETRRQPTAPIKTLQFGQYTKTSESTDSCAPIIKISQHSIEGDVLVIGRYRFSMELRPPFISMESTVTGSIGCTDTSEQKRDDIKENGKEIQTELTNTIGQTCKVDEDFPNRPLSTEIKETLTILPGQIKFESTDSSVHFSKTCVWVLKPAANNRPGSQPAATTKD